MNVVVDDHLLIGVLLHRMPPKLASLVGSGRIFSTGLWYHRLCRALRNTSVRGRLSAAVADLADADALGVLAHVVALPDEVGIVSMRDLAWPMAAVLEEHRLNLIGLEAVAAAQHVGGALCLSAGDDSPPIRHAATSVGIRYETVAAR